MKNRKTIIAIATILILIITSAVYVINANGKVGYIFETVKVARGSISNTVTATGTLEATNTVVVGTQVSGVIEKLYVDFNSKVKKGQLIAELDKSTLKSNLEIRRQEQSNAFFKGIIKPHEQIDFTMCNPPFHASLEESQAGTLRKLSNLKNQKITKPELNFGGKEGELWTEGGEKRFILNMIRQSKRFGKSCCWFSTIVSKQSNLKYIYRELDEIMAEEYKTIPMGQGNKTSRIVAWTFLSVEEEKNWVKDRW